MLSSGGAYLPRQVKSVSHLTFTTLSGLVVYMHTGVADPYALKWCVIWLAFLLTRWTLKLRRAAYSHAYFTIIVRQNLMFGMLLFILSEIMIFFALFWSYFHVSVNPASTLGGVWPPVGLTVLEWWRWPTLSTALLLYSGMTVNVFYYSIKTLNSVSFLKGNGQTKKLRAFINDKQKLTTALFVDSKFNTSLINTTNFKEFITQVEKNEFIKNIKKEIQTFEHYWFYATNTLAYEQRKNFVIEQTHGKVYYRIRIYYHYRRTNVYTIKCQKAWAYGAFMFEYMRWRLNFVFGGLFYTILAGSTFVGCQLYEYSHASYDITDGAYGSIFYSLTGLHGLHGAGCNPHPGSITQRAPDSDSFTSRESTLRGVGGFITLNRAGVNVSTDCHKVTHTWRWNSPPNSLKTAIAPHHRMLPAHTATAAGSFPNVAWFGSSYKSDDIRQDAGITTIVPENLAAETAPPDNGEVRKSTSLDADIVNNELASIIKVRKVVKPFEHAVSPENLRQAWAQLKNTSGRRTGEINCEHLNKINNEWFETASDNLLKGQFKYPTRRRSYIPKHGQMETTRPITTTNPRVQIVERAILNALEPLYEGLWEWSPTSEPDLDNFRKNTKEPNSWKRNKQGCFIKKWLIPRVFLNSSHGFRQGRSAHTALASIKKWRKDVVWLLDYDAQKAFDNVNRLRLKNLLAKRVKDVRFWREIAKMMNAGIIDVSAIYNTHGIPCGSVLAPFLFNVYMHELDHFISSIKKKYDVNQRNDKTSIATQAYWRILNNFGLRQLPVRLKELGSVDAVLKKRRDALKKHEAEYGRMGGVNTKLRHIHYCRYADDFILGIVGPKDFALTIQNSINTFLKSDLHLEIKKNALVGRNSESTRFLGYNIKLAPFRKKVRSIKAAHESVMRYKKRVALRLTGLDKKLSKATAYAARTALLRAYRTRLEQTGKKWAKKSDRDAVANEVVAHIPNENASLRRRERASRKMFTEALDHPLRAAIKTLNIPTTEVELADEVTNAKIDFLAKLDSIHKKVLENQGAYTDERSMSAYDKWATRKYSNTAGITRTDFLKYGQALHLDNAGKEYVSEIAILAPVKDTVARLRMHGYFHPKQDRPQGNPSMISMSDIDIVRRFATLIHDIINWFRPADNLNKVKSLMSALRLSCAYTIARKHNKTYAWVIQRYGKDVSIAYRGSRVQLPTEEWIRTLSSKFLVDTDGVFDLDKILRSQTHSKTITDGFFEWCAVSGCEEGGIEIHHVKKLHRKVTKNNVVSILNKAGKRVTGIAAILAASQRKQIPLCRKHNLEFEKGKYSAIDFDYFSKAFGGAPVDDADRLFLTGTSLVTPPPTKIENKTHNKTSLPPPTTRLSQRDLDDPHGLAATILSTLDDK